MFIYNIYNICILYFLWIKNVFDFFFSASQTPTTTNIPCIWCRRWHTAQRTRRQSVANKHVIIKKYAYVCILQINQKPIKWHIIIRSRDAIFFWTKDSNKIFCKFEIMNFLESQQLCSVGFTYLCVKFPKKMLENYSLKILVKIWLYKRSFPIRHSWYIPHLRISIFRWVVSIIRCKANMCDLYLIVFVFKMPSVMRLKWYVPMPSKKKEIKRLEAIIIDD